MRNGLVYLALLFASANAFAQSGRETKAETLARWHFVGTKQLAAAKDLLSLREILALKESEDLRNAAMDGFALHVAGRFTRTNETNINAQVGTSRPRIAAETEAEARRRTRGARSMAGGRSIQQLAIDL